MKQAFTTPYIIYTSYLVILFILSSCSNDMTFNLPETDPLLSVQSFIGPDHDSRVRVTMARGIQDPAIQMNIDCQVDLFESGVFYKSLTLDTPAILSGTISTQGYLEFPVDTSIVLSEGKEYSVKVNYPGFETVTARDTKPYVVKIKEIAWRNFTGELPEWYFDTPTYRSFLAINGESPEDIDSLIEYTIILEDIPGIKNFYRIGLNEEFYIGAPAPHSFRDFRRQYALYTDPDPPYTSFLYNARYYLETGSGSLKSNSFLPWTQTITSEILWKDSDFDGSRHSLVIVAPRPYEGSKCIISLYSLSESYYKYMIDRWKYYKVSDDPFSEPIRLYSNTSNGCGIFAMYSVDKDTLQF